MEDEIRERIAKVMPPVNCETCCLHKPGNYTRKDCVTYGKRLCALEIKQADQILSYLREQGWREVDPEKLPVISRQERMVANPECPGQIKTAVGDEIYCICNFNVKPCLVEYGNDCENYNEFLKEKTTEDEIREKLFKLILPQVIHPTQSIDENILVAERLADQILSFLHKRGYQKREATLKEVGEFLERED